MAVRERTIVNPRLEGGEMVVSRYYPSAPGFNTLSFRSRLAWRLRRLADMIDRGLSYRLSGKWPAGIGDQDLFDAFCYGATAMQKYMTDLQEDRRV